MSGFYLGLEPVQGGGTLIARGDITGRVSLKAGADRLLVVVTGESAGDNLLDCFRAAMEQKLLLTDMRTLVDVTHFVGASTMAKGPRTSPGCAVSQEGWHGSQTRV